MFSPDPSAVSRRLKSGGATLDVGSGAYSQVNTSGRLIWETLIDGVERVDLIEDLAVNFDIDHERAMADFDAFVGQLEERSLVDIGE